MLVLQSGLMKSGNYWLYQILQEIIREAGIENKNFIANDPIQAAAQTWDLSFPEQATLNQIHMTPRGITYKIGNIFEMPITDIDAYLARNTHVWTHADINDITLEVLPKFDKIVYIVRDPRDVLISWANFWFTPYRKKFTPIFVETPEQQLENHLVSRMDIWQKEVLNYLMVSQECNIYVLFYENLLADFQQELSGLLNYLEIDLDEAAREVIEHNTSFNEMKKTSPHHLRKGASYKWVSKLSDEQKKRSLRIAGDLIELLGYPTGENDIDKLPSLERVTPEKLGKIHARINHQPLKERVKSGLINVIRKL